MNKMQQMFREAMEKMGVPILCNVGSAHIPLLGFETTAGTVEDSEYTEAASNSFHYINSETAILTAVIAGGAGEIQFVEKAMGRAALVALEAHGRRPGEATRIAHQALAIHPCCPEAYNVLATHAATSYQEALSFYLEGIRQGPHVLSEEDYAECCKQKKVFMIPPLRPLFRCMAGAALVLLKMGRLEESYDMYQKLRKLDDNGYRLTSYVNLRYHLPLLLYRWKGIPFAEKYMHAAAVSENYTLVSTQVAWVYTQALMDFKKAGRPYFPWHYFGMLRAFQSEDQITDADRERICRSGCAVQLGIHQAPLVVELLTGERPMPRGPLPTTFHSVGELAQAVAYVHAAGDLWRNTPGAIDWLRKCRGAWNLILMVREVENHPYSFEKAKAFMAEKGFVLGGREPGDRHERDLMLVDAVNCKKASGDLVDLLIEEGGCDPNVVDSQGLRPINKALYYDRPASTIKSLIRHGAKVAAPTAESFSPLAMAINQGNHLALRAALEELPAIASSQPELRSLYEQLFQTNCFMCVKGLLHPKCQRCRFEPESPHSKEVSFEKCVDVLAEFGLRMDPRLERHVQSEMCHPLQATLITRLTIQGKLQARKKKQLGDATKRLEGLDVASGSNSTACETPQKGKGKKSKKGGDRSKECTLCKKTDVKILRCARCNVTGYCSPECQRTDWPRHKVECKALAAKAANNQAS